MTTTPQEPRPDLAPDEEQNQDPNPESSKSDGVIPTERELDPEGTEPDAYRDGDPGQ